MNYSKPPSLVTAKPVKARTLSPRLLLAGLVAVALVGLLIFRLVGSETGASASRGRGTTAAPVREALTETRDVPIIARTIGTVLPNMTVSVKSQIDGQLMAAKFDEGQIVKAGDVLFQIDPRPSEAALRQTEAQIARDRAQLASAQSDADRAMSLAERGIVSTQQRDQLVAEAKALSATVAADQAAADRAQLSVGFTTIRAPITGKTGPITIHPGNLVRANMDELVVINQIQPVKISFFLPQSYLPPLQDRLREGSLIATANLRSDSGAPAQSENEMSVKVDFIGNTVDEKTGTIELRATSQNPDLRLVPGELVDMSVQLDTMRKTVVVPREAVNIGQDGGTYVFVDQDGKAVMKPVTVRYQDDKIAAIGSDIAPGVKVVTDGQLRVTPGVQLSVIGAPTATHAAGGGMAASEDGGKGGRHRGSAQ